MGCPLEMIRFYVRSGRAFWISSSVFVHLLEAGESEINRDEPKKINIFLLIADGPGKKKNEETPVGGIRDFPESVHRHRH